VTIAGHGLTKTSAVQFGGSDATRITVKSDDELEVVPPPHPGGAVPISVTAVNAGGTSVSLLPDPGAPVFTYDGCGIPVGAGQVSLPPGYSLIGFPSGTVVPAASLLYSWFDRGSGRYDAQRPDDATAPVIAGHGYWAYSGCPKVVSVPAAQGTPVSFALGAYHASMVGNPSSSRSAVVSGHDFAARWDPSLNGGAGGYDISGYRAPQRLGVGQGDWVFAYAATTVNISDG